MLESSEDFVLSVKHALDNAKKRIRILENLDKKCLLEAYKEWIQDDLSNHQILIFREDPII